ncbi:hypothetical protein E2C01_012078 [Portunus trituberculatus]|uniref:Uncharacterized protein n=1 Tax=Portunus trituberculatus TaxID=210409 RepID=A0A5B7DD63_PORTR|nr:hypothetical protein [Portunus trituberculatus]
MRLLEDMSLTKKTLDLVFSPRPNCSAIFLDVWVDGLITQWVLNEKKIGNPCIRKLNRVGDERRKKA